MEKLDFNNAPFSWKGMIPEAGEDITPLWGRKIVNNFVNGYGLIGTVVVGANDSQAINMQLTKQFMLPPSVSFYYTSGYFSTYGLILGRQNIDVDDFMSGQFNGVTKNITYFISGDVLIFFNKLDNDATIYYRVHGV